MECARPVAPLAKRNGRRAFWLVEPHHLTQEATIWFAIGVAWNLRNHAEFGGAQVRGEMHPAMPPDRFNEHGVCIRLHCHYDDDALPAYGVRNA